MSRHRSYAHAKRCVNRDYLRITLHDRRRLLLFTKAEPTSDRIARESTSADRLAGSGANGPMVSELSGRNGVNPEVASKQFSEGRIRSFGRKAAWQASRLADAAGHFGGVVGPAR